MGARVGHTSLREKEFLKTRKVSITAIDVQSEN